MKRYLSRAALRSLSIVVLLGGSAGLALSHADPEARHYENGTFGFSLNLAGGLADYRAVNSPEGITLTSPDGRAVVNIFGSWNETGKSLAAVVDQYKRDVPDAEFTYEWHGRNAAVLSGYQSGDIFYVRIEMSPDQRKVAVLNMIYAPELKRELDPVVTRLSTSLRIR